MTNRLTRGNAGTLWGVLVLVFSAAVVEAQTPAPAVEAPTAPRQVLLLYSYDRDFAPHFSFVELFRPELSRASSTPIEFIELSLRAAREKERAMESATQNPRESPSASDKSLTRRLRSMLAGREPDLVVPIGWPAAAYTLSHRKRLFPEASILLAGLDRRQLALLRYAERLIGPRDSARTKTTAVAFDQEPKRLLENILNVLPDTKHVFVVVGSSNLESWLLEGMKREFRPYEDRVTFSWTNDLSFPEVLKQSAQLPPQSAILYAMMAKDSKGEPYVENTALAELHANAKAPIFGGRSTQFDRGIVGGPLLSIEDLSRNTANTALRLLAGESPSDIDVPTQKLAAPVFDARELSRWNIDEGRLVAGSTIRFREPTAWEKYRQPIMAFAAVFGMQAIVVVGLVANLARRRRAERTLRESEGRFRMMSKGLSNLARRLMQTHEQERAKVARELQDDLCQRMMGLTMQLHAASQVACEEEARRRVRELSSQFARLTSEIFTISHQLHCSNLTLLGLVSAARIDCKEISKEQEVRFDCDEGSIPANMPDGVALALFRVMQEAARNAVKHSGAGFVSVSLRGDREGVRLEVADEGAGFDPEAALKSGGLGLIGMKERISLVDGEFTIDSAPGAGTRIRAQVPYSPTLQADGRPS